MSRRLVVSLAAIPAILLLSFAAPGPLQAGRGGGGGGHGGGGHGGGMHGSMGHSGTAEPLISAISVDSIRGM